MHAGVVEPQPVQVAEEDLPVPSAQRATHADVEFSVGLCACGVYIAIREWRPRSARIYDNVLSLLLLILITEHVRGRASVDGAAMPTASAPAPAPAGVSMIHLGPPPARLRRAEERDEVQRWSSSRRVTRHPGAVPDTSARTALAGAHALCLSLSLVIDPGTGRKRSAALSSIEPSCCPPTTPPSSRSARLKGAGEGADAETSSARIWGLSPRTCVVHLVGTSDALLISTHPARRPSAVMAPHRPVAFVATLPSLDPRLRCDDRHRVLENLVVREGTRGHPAGQLGRRTQEVG